METPRQLAETPEQALLYNSRVAPECLADIMTCSIERNSAVVDILLADLVDQDSFTVPIPTVRNLLWLLQGQFQQMRQIIAGYTTRANPTTQQPDEGADKRKGRPAATGQPSKHAGPLEESDQPPHAQEKSFSADNSTPSPPNC